MPEQREHSAGTGAVRSVARALRLLTTLSAERLTLTEAAQLARIPLPTALRLMRTLEAEAFAVRLDDGSFKLGPAAIRLAYEADPEGPLRWTVRQTVARLRDRVNETVCFFVRRGGERLCLESAESRHAVRWVNPRGSRGPLHTTAAGKVLLALGPTDELLAQIPMPEGHYECAGGRVRQLADLQAELDNIRRNEAVAVSDQESSSDLWSFALPFVVDGVCLGAFEFGIPRERARATNEDLVDTCRAIVDEVTAGLPRSAMRAPTPLADER